MKEIVGAIAVRAAAAAGGVGVVSSGPILAALSEAIDRGMRLGGLYDGPQMDLVRRQWQAAHVGADKINTWDKVAGHLVRKNSIPYNHNRPHQPHNFMHNKLVVSDDIVVTGSLTCRTTPWATPRTFCSSMTPASLRLMRPISKNSRYDTATRCIRRGADIGPPSGERVTARGKQPRKSVAEKIGVFALAQIGQRIEPCAIRRRLCPDGT